MDWAQILTGISNSPAWQFTIGVMVLVLGSSAILSEKVAKEKFWLIGSLAAWFQKRKEREAELEIEREKRILDDLRSEIQRMDDRVCVLERSDERKHKYIVYVTNWYRHLELWAADKGITLMDDPPFKPFGEWLVQDREEGK